MGGIKDIIDGGRDEVNERCHGFAVSIIESSEFLHSIGDAVDDNKRETKFDLDYILDNPPHNYCPSGKEWELIIHHLKELLDGEGVRITGYGFENDNDNYMVYLEW